MIIQIGKQNNKDIREFQGVKGIDDKDSVLAELNNNNLGSNYTELKEDASGIDGVYVLNVNAGGLLTWYKL